MRLAILIWLGIVWGGAGTVAPLPTPPEDFTADQFIAADGCAFLRRGSDWVPRLDGDDRPFCGFPPSQMPGEEASQQDGRAAVERLSDLLQEGLRAGERVSDKRPPESRSAPLPEPTDPELAALFGTAGLTTMRRMQVLLYAGPQRVETCARLGYAPTTRTSPGTDVTGGLCGDQVLQALSGRHAREESRPVPRPLPRPELSSVKPRQRDAAGVPLVSGVSQMPPPRKPHGKDQLGYVETGEIVQSPGQTAKLVRRLQALGLGAGRVPATPLPGHRIMAGPFQDRQAMIAALDQLRRHGFPKARLP